MKFDGVLIRYSEIALKGKNRLDFERKLMENISNVFDGEYTVERVYGRLILKGRTLTKSEVREILGRLKKIFGIKWANPMVETGFELNEIVGSAVELSKYERSKGFKTFKVDTRRTNKSFPIGSMRMNELLGAEILKNFPDLRVNLENPDFTINVEIREKGVYIYSESERGPGGLPVTTGGKVLLLLSGGIDSPVAGWLMMKRGVKIDCISFISPPFTNDKTRWKIIEVTKKLSEFSSGHPIHLFLVPLTDLLMHIKERIPDDYMLVVQRRIMMKVANRVADTIGAFALTTGENLGQVASQTLQNLHTIEEASDRMVLRPLLTYDKEEIISRAKEIGTYDISIQPYPDLCVLFTPEHPVTKSKLEKVKKVEEKLGDISKMVEEVMNDMEEVVIRNGEIVEDS